MFVNISPTLASSQETLCSLRFANQVSQIELGRARKHVLQVQVAPIISAPAPAMAPIPHASIENVSASVSNVTAAGIAASHARRSSMSLNPMRCAPDGTAAASQAVILKSSKGSEAYVSHHLMETASMKSQQSITSKRSFTGSIPSQSIVGSIPNSGNLNIQKKQKTSTQYASGALGQSSSSGKMSSWR